MKKTYLYGAIIILLIILSYVPLFTLDFERIINITDEDHIYENLQALFFLLSAGLMFFLFIRSKSEEKNLFLKTNRNYFFLFLGLLLFFFFAEEISWGQRIIGIQTSEYLKNINSQEETNIHNLWLFSSYDKNISTKTGLMNWITAARLFALFWFIYCVIIPILNYLSDGMRKIFKKINIPIVPLWIGFIFIIAHIISKIAEKMWIYTNEQPVTEIKECSFAFLFFVLSLSFFVIYKKSISPKG